MLKIVFCLSGPSFSYQFLANWTKLLQACPDYGVSWQAIFVDSTDLSKIIKDCSKRKFDYLMLIAADSLFEPQHFQNLLNKMEKNPKINALTAKSLKGESATFGFTLIRKGVLEKKAKKTGFYPSLDPQTIIGYEKTVIWR